jgi:hypothetical protein
MHRTSMDIDKPRHNILKREYLGRKQWAYRIVYRVILNVVADFPFYYTSYCKLSIREGFKKIFSLILPQPHSPLAGAGCDGAAVGRECHARNLPCVALELPQLLARSGIP